MEKTNLLFLFQSRRRAMKEFQCPSCKKFVYEYPAISRKDNKTEICSTCGTMEALNDFAQSQETQKCYSCESEIDEHCCGDHDDSYCESCCEAKRQDDRENYYESMNDLD